MAEFLLIHGASHGAWCWERILPRLRVLGHTASAIDLPGHGDDRTPPGSVRLVDYTAAVRRHLQPETILVGHSFGGVPITMAAAEAPRQVRTLVYVAAILPRPGEPFTAFQREALSPEVSATMKVDHDAGVTRADPETAGPVFYSDCSAEDCAAALARLTPQPVAVMTERADFTPPDTPRHYIRCLDDRVVRPDYQRNASHGWTGVHELRTGHSPFYSDLDGLTEMLDWIANG